MEERLNQKSFQIKASKADFNGTNKSYAVFKIQFVKSFQCLSVRMSGDLSHVLFSDTVISIDTRFGKKVETERSHMQCSYMTLKDGPHTCKLKVQKCCLEYNHVGYQMS